MDSKPICQPSPANKMKYFFLDCVHFWWSARLVDGLKPHLPPLSSQKHEMLIFVLHLISDVGQTCQWTRTPSTIPLQPKNEMLIFVLHSTSDDWLGWSMDSNPIHHPSPANKMKSSFLDYVQLLMISQAGQWTRTPSANPLQPIKWNAHFWITFTLDDWPGWSMDSNPIHHPSPPNKMKCSYFDYVQLLMISLAGQWTQNPSATPLQPIKWNASFWIVFTSDDQPGWLMDSNPICHPSPANKMKCSFLDYIHFGWLARLVNGLKPHSPPLSSQ